MQYRILETIVIVVKSNSSISKSVLLLQQRTISLIETYRAFWPEITRLDESRSVPCIVVISWKGAVLLNCNSNNVVR